MTESLTTRIRVMASWGGWAAAAAVLLAWAVGLTPGIGGAKQSATMIPNVSPATPEQAFQNYLDAGQKAGCVVGEVPTKTMVEVRPSETGTGYDVIYIRQILERTHVPELYRYGGVDDKGQPRIVPAEMTDPGRPM